MPITDSTAITNNTENEGIRLMGVIAHSYDTPNNTKPATQKD